MDQAAQDALDRAMSYTGGSWVNLKEIGDTVEGVVLSFDVRDKTFKGETVCYASGPKKGQPRSEWVLSLSTADRDPEIEDDDGKRKVSLGEPAQQAIAKALGEAKLSASDFVGSTLKLRRTVAAKQGESGGEFVARTTAGNAASAALVAAVAAESSAPAAPSAPKVEDDF